MSQPTIPVSTHADDECSVVVVTAPASVMGDESPKGGPKEATKAAEQKPDVEIADVPAGEKRDKSGDKATDKKEGDDGSVKDGEGEEGEKTVIGMFCETKNLYQKMDKYNKPVWTEEYPDDLQEAAENEETQKFAILVRNKKSYDSRKSLEIDSIVVQSPLIKQVLRDVLKDYPGVTTTLNRLTFAAPFRPFVHRWNQFTDAVSSDEYDENTRDHVKLLYDVLKEELKDVISALKDYIKNKVISYEHIWTIFQPDCVIYTSRFGQPLAAKLVEGQFTNHCRLGPCFMLKCNGVDYDGYKFGYCLSSQPIVPFSGTMPINALDAYPMEFHTDADAAKDSLITRGKLFERFAGYHYKSYTGSAIEIDPEYGPSLVTCDSRVIIDTHAYCKANPGHKPNVKPLKKVELNLDIYAKDDEDGGYQRDDSYDYDPYGMANEDFYLDLQQEKKQLIPLTDDQLLLCSPMVRGYGLKPKRWQQYFVEQIADIQFNDQAFESLVLPKGHKSLILAFAQSQVKNKNAFDDVIQGKGKGIIMLLSGGPGIGKTLTAESVAEAMRVPLYSMGSGDIGTASWEVENKLQSTLELVAKWNAVLLLDECDVFLEERSTHDLERNKIVSIFLRTLEYYEGIMFLTTNRVANIDPAFDSRIHLSLEYPDLDVAARKAVWKGFLERSIGVEMEKAKAGEEVVGYTVTDEQIDELAELDLNGRVIKNVLKTSNLLAAHGSEKLTFEHLMTVLRIGGHLKKRESKSTKTNNEQ